MTSPAERSKEAREKDFWRNVRAALLEWRKEQLKSGGPHHLTVRSVTMARMYKQERRLWRLACKLARMAEKSKP